MNEVCSGRSWKKIACCSRALVEYSSTQRSISGWLYLADSLFSDRGVTVVEVVERSSHSTAQTNLLFKRMEVGYDQVVERPDSPQVRRLRSCPCAAAARVARRWGMAAPRYCLAALQLQPLRVLPTALQPAHHSPSSPSNNLTGCPP